MKETMFSPSQIMKFYEKKDIYIYENHYGEWSMFVCVTFIKDPHPNEVIHFSTPRVVLTTFQKTWRSLIIQQRI
jgi:hypothetical protein